MAKKTVEQEIVVPYGHFIVRVDQAELDKRRAINEEIEKEREEMKDKEIQLSEEDQMLADDDPFIIDEARDVPTETVFKAHSKSELKEGDEVVAMSQVDPTMIKRGEYLYYIYPERYFLIGFRSKGV